MASRSYGCKRTHLRIVLTKLAAQRLTTKKHAMNDEHEICEVCGKPVLPGQARHGVRGGHWDCHYPNGVPEKESLAAIRKRGDEAIKKIEEAIDKLRKLRYR